MQRRIIDNGPGGSTLRLSCGHEVLCSTTVGTTADCERCDRRQLPAQTSMGRRTPTFMAGTVPAGLLREHRTTAWARLEVETGSVTFHEDDPRWQTTVTRAKPLVIVPDRTHRIELSEDARFAVQFFDLPAHLAQTS